MTLNNIIWLMRKINPNYPLIEMEKIKFKKIHIFIHIFIAFLLISSFSIIIYFLWGKLFMIFSILPILFLCLQFSFWVYKLHEKKEIGWNKSRFAVKTAQDLLLNAGGDVKSEYIEKEMIRNIQQYHWLKESQLFINNSLSKNKERVENFILTFNKERFYIRHELFKNKKTKISIGFFKKEIKDTDKEVFFTEFWLKEIFNEGFKGNIDEETIKKDDQKFVIYSFSTPGKKYCEFSLKIMFIIGIIIANKTHFEI